MPGSLRTVLAGTALGQESDHPVRVALAVARAAGARLHLVHAFAPPIGFGGELAVGIGDESLVELERDRLRDVLAAQVERLGIAPGELAGSGVEIGAPHRVLPDLAERLDADLLVLGATVPGAAARLLGSTAERVLRKAGCPVLVVRGALSVPPRRALAAVDLSPLSAEAFRRGLALLGSLTGGEGGEATEVAALFVLSVLQRQVAPQFTPEQVDRFAAEELERFVALNAGPAASRVARRVRTGNPREEILAELAERPADLLVLGTHGLGGFDRLVIGSVASDVVREAPASVLVVPPRARREIQ
jgi:nucleotide-binding universal stress UspA family protein